MKSTLNICKIIKSEVALIDIYKCFIIYLHIFKKQQKFFEKQKKFLGSSFRNKRIGFKNYFKKNAKA